MWIGLKPTARPMRDWKEVRQRKGSGERKTGHVESVSPCGSWQESPGQIQGQEGRQGSSQQALV